MDKHSNRDGICALGLERFNLSVRARNCLRRERISTVGALAEVGADKILKWRGAGKKTLQEYRVLLGKLGLGFKGEISRGRIDEEWFAKQLDEANRRRKPSSKTILLNEASTELQRTLVIPVSALPLSVRARNVLDAASASYVGEVARMRASDVMAIRSSGRKTKTELERSLRGLGLDFGMKIPDWSREKVMIIRRQLRAEIEEDLRERDKQLLTSVGPEPNSLEQELARIARVLDKERNANLLVRLWGWNGSPPRTLESVGTELGLTRERVRQIEARAIKKLKNHKFQVPYLKSAISLLRQNVPELSDVLAGKLRESGVSYSDFSPEGVRVAAQLLDLKWPFEFVIVSNVQAITFMGEADQLRKARSVLRRKTSEQGCLNLVALTAELKTDQGQLPGIVRFLERTEQAKWLDQNHEWLYSTASQRNRLLNICAKVFAVAERIHLTELRRAVSKSRRLAMCPPQRILATFVEQTGLAQVLNGFAYPVPGAGISLTPGSAEARMLEVLNKHGPVMDGEVFAEKCIAEGINATTVYIYRLISPVITALGRNVFCKVGTEVPPGTIEAIVARRRSTPLVAEHGWTTDGKLWFGTELTRQVIVAGSIRMPAFVTDFVQGKWRVILPDDTEFDSVTCRDVFIWSFRKQFALLGAEPLDFAIFEFNLKERTVLVKVGGPGLLEAIQDPESLLDELESDEPLAS